MKNIKQIAKLSEGFKGEITVRLSNSSIESYQRKSTFRNLYLTSIGYYPNARLHYYERTKEQSNYFILLYCIAGDGFCNIGGVDYKIDTNQYIIIPRGISHSYGSSVDNPWSIYWAHFNGECSAKLSPILARPQHINPDVNSRIKERIDLFEQIITLLKSDYTFEAMEYANSCFLHFIYSLIHIDKYRNITTNSAPQSTVSQKAIHYMREGIERNISVDELASFCGYSKGRFITIFRQEVGESPIHHFNRLKIELACQYIRQTSIKTEQICHKIGITNPLYFSRLFKQFMSIPPSEYKRTINKL
ncbi:MAG: AraC family transcriptional regulator [Rikenellaceae bacterium]